MSKRLSTPTSTFGKITSLFGIFSRKKTDEASTDSKSSAQDPKLETLLAMFKEGRYIEVETEARQLLSTAPYKNSGSVWKRLGSALLMQGKDDLSAWQKAAELLPNDVGSNFHLARSLEKHKMLTEAMNSYHRVLEINADFIEAHNNLANILRDMERNEDAVTSYQRAIKIKPDCLEAHFNLANTLHALGQYEEAIESYQQALKIKPDYAETYSDMGVVFQDLGKFDEALASYRKALEYDPLCFEAQNYLVFTNTYIANQSPQVLTQEALQFGKTARSQAQAFTSWPNSMERDRCLRIGLVSGDLRNHSVGFFVQGLISVLATHWAKRLKICAYNVNSKKPDDISDDIRLHCHLWNNVADMSDTELAEQIRNDEVDILIDLSGHSARNRLLMFAMKPAPVQVTWCGFLATSGLAEMDYILGDPVVTPSEDAHYYAEKIWPMPDAWCCFTHPYVSPDDKPLPALSAQGVMFGSFNNLNKMNDEVVSLWARVLLAVEGSTLFLKTKQLKNPEVRALTEKRFAAHGIDASRLLLEGASPRRELLEAYNRLDIALDPFPYGGGTTNFETLWMGIPFLTLRGNSFLSRCGESLATCVGLDDWIANDADDFVARAVAHTRDLQRLAALRNDLRKKVPTSPLFDIERFATNFEAAMRGMWENWCNAQQITE